MHFKILLVQMLVWFPTAQHQVNSFFKRLRTSIMKVRRGVGDIAQRRRFECSHIFRPVGYGLRTGLLGAPARATQAASPLLFGLLMDHMGIGVLAISAGLSLSALVALLLLNP